MLGRTFTWVICESLMLRTNQENSPNRHHRETTYGSQDTSSLAAVHRDRGGQPGRPTPPLPRPSASSHPNYPSRGRVAQAGVMRSTRRVCNQLTPPSFALRPRPARPYFDLQGHREARGQAFHGRDHDVPHSATSPSDLRRSAVDSTAIKHFTSTHAKAPVTEPPPISHLHRQRTLRWAGSRQFSSAF